MKKIRIREFERYIFRNPTSDLHMLRQIEIEMTRHQCDGTLEMSTKATQLRTNQLKQYRENRAAALFTYGMSIVQGHDIFYAPVEDQDFDFITTWTNQDTQHYCTVQLKELVPESLNPNSTIEELLEKLGKYGDSRDLTIAIQINRAGNWNPNSLKLSRKLPLNGIWFFHASAEDQSKFIIWGDWLNDEPCVGLEFDYPKPLGILF
ncbi:hypothetical protein [Hirschia baltica]|uniref:Uncharacterized protein n=1 Tax=Hirschia baltica (strain ATCC 49814 / DSM 5838 / IFAM 1418) TaxID=582402 RepID=C6XMP5_HIRBI|nr:hypothetical protein [Hirschia baltica]ACT59959.1 hypothetical protein Hbal_2279 [Hirschia baltica ATCC 49814]